MGGAEIAHWGILLLAALVVGVSKTAMPAISSLAVALFAWQLSPRAATGALLVLLLVGDAIAVATYWRATDWTTLRRLLPAVLLGIGAGAAVLAVIDDTVLRRLIGFILIGIVALAMAERWYGLVRTRRAQRDGLAAHDAEPAARSPRGDRLRAGAFGALGGFTTMTANVGGSVMSAYFLASRLPVSTFLGTAAWFFLVVNLIKLPVAVGLGLLGWGELLMVLPLVPGVVIGAWLGRRGVALIDRSAFEIVVAVLTIASAVVLIV